MMRQGLASAQTAGRAVIRGTVTDSAGRPIALANVRILGADVGTTTDSGGVFVLPAVAPATYLVEARAIGWKPLTFTITVKDGEEWEGRIGLEPSPARLPELRVEGRYAKPAKYRNTTRFDDFYRRRATGFGHYFTREQVDRAIDTGALRLNNLIERMHLPGYRSGRFTRCRTPGAVGVWIDGARVAGHGRDPFLEVGRLLNVRDVEAIEVYEGAAQLPAEFLDGTCAAVVIWTKYN